MFIVVKELNENTLENFGEFRTYQEAEITAKFITAFLGYDLKIIKV